MKIEGNDFAANLHPSITSMLEESKWMRRLQYKTPEGLYNLRRANIKETLVRVLVCHQPHGHVFKEGIHVGLVRVVRIRKEGGKRWRGKWRQGERTGLRKRKRRE